MDFLSQQNTDELYKFIRNDVFQKSNLDINNNETRDMLTKFMKSLYEKNNNKNTTYLNNLVIEKIVPYLIKKNETNNNIRGLELNLQPKYMDRINNNNISIPKKEISNFNPVNNYSPNISSRPSIVDKQNKPNFNVQDYNKDSINSLLGSLEVIERPILTNNKLDNKNTEEMYQKMSQERNYNVLVNDQNNFEGEIQRAQATQKIVFENIQNNKNRKNEISQMKKNRPELEFDPKKFYVEMNNLKEKTMQKPQFNLHSKDFSKENVIQGNDKEIDELIKPDWRSKDINEISKQSLSELYQPEGYIKERSNREFVILDSDVIADNTDASFSLNLVEPLVIDKMCDVYLEFLSIQSLSIQGGTALETLPCLVLSIDELPMNTSSNISNLSNKYIIPNEAYGISKGEKVTSSSNTVSSINIKLKSNYMTTITPQTFNKFTVNLFGYNTAGSLSLLHGTPADSDASKAGRVIMGLIFKKQ